MASKHLASYLNDHLAGSAMAIELLAYIGTAYPEAEIGGFALALREEVIADRKVLEELMARLDISQSTPKKASAWMGEKVAQLKLRWDDPAGGSFRLLEAMDAVSIGIEGKRLLWIVLNTVSKVDAALAGQDYDRLIRRAEEQRGRVEAVRCNAAAKALGG